MAIIFEIVFIIFAVFLTDLLTYKYIRILDKKEREKLSKKENERIAELIKMCGNDSEKVVEILND